VDRGTELSMVVISTLLSMGDMSVVIVGIDRRDGVKIFFLINLIPGPNARRGRTKITITTRMYLYVFFKTSSRKEHYLIL
ncbi:MAG: hypothetical protein ACXWWM_00620, partial [Candidatus Deferrimicrobiaceae bacterium]